MLFKFILTIFNIYLFIIKSKINYDVSKATSISDPTDTEKNKIATAYNDIKNSEFINSLIDIYKKLEGINFSA